MARRMSMGSIVCASVVSIWLVRPLETTPIVHAQPAEPRRQIAAVVSTSRLRPQSLDAALAHGNRHGEVRRREDSYWHVLEIATDRSQSVSRDELESLWMESADRGVPPESLDALEAIMDAEVDSEIVRLARMYHDDLMALQDRLESRQPDAAHDDRAASSDRTHIARLEWSLHHSLEASEVEAAIAELARGRDDSSIAVLVDGADHPDAARRALILRQLWPAAADGVLTDLVVDRLERATYDPDDSVAEFARLALDDLARIEVEQ